MVDIGSDEHCCPEAGFEGKGQDDDTDPKFLRDAQGGTVATKGARKFHLKLDGASISTGLPRKIRAEANFQLSKCPRAHLFDVKSRRQRLSLHDERPYGVHGERRLSSANEDATELLIHRGLGHVHFKLGHQRSIST